MLTISLTLNFFNTLIFLFWKTSCTNEMLIRFLSVLCIFYAVLTITQPLTILTIFAICTFLTTITFFTILWCYHISTSVTLLNINTIVACNRFYAAYAINAATTFLAALTIYASKASWQHFTVSAIFCCVTNNAVFVHSEI